MATFDDIIARAIGDPGSIVPREGDDETVTRWSTRAVTTIMATIFGVGPEGEYPGTPAFLALMENAQLRARLRVADDLLHEANGIIHSAENLKLTLTCLSLHCIEGDHDFDMRNPVPIGDQDWRDAQRRWAVGWHDFIRSDRPTDCSHCDGLDGTHTVRDCEGKRRSEMLDLPCPDGDRPHVLRDCEGDPIHDPERNLP